MLFDRRNFLKNIGIAFSSLGMMNLLGSKQLEASVGDKSFKKSKYIQHFYQQLHKWHCQSFFDFDKEFHPVEKLYVEKCISLMDDWAYEANDQFVYSLASYSHQVSSKGVNSSRISYGSYQYAEELKPYLKEVLELRSIPLAVLDDKKVIGLGWDFEAEVFKIYFHHEDLTQIQDPELLKLRAKVEDDVYQTALSSYSYIGKKLVEKKLYLALKEKLPSRFEHLFSKGDSVSHTNLMVSSTRGVIPQMDLDHYNYQDLDQHGKLLFKQYKTAFGNQLDTISYNNKDTYTLYFPH